MKSSGIFYLLFLILFFKGCSTNNSNNNTATPLQDIYKYFDELSLNEFHFTDLDQKLNAARGKNIIDEVNSATKEFEVSQANCIQKMMAKFPEGSVKIPFEQIHGNDTLTVKSVYLSGFSFPWNTATTICFYFTIEYKLLKKNLWFVPISLKFLDVEDDIIYTCTLPANSGGKSKFLIRAQFTFRQFKKIIINQ